MSNLTEEQIRQIVRDERDKLREEEQDACTHGKSGTLVDGETTCDRCGKIVVYVPGMGTGGYKNSPIDTRQIIAVTEVTPQSKSVPSKKEEK